MSGSVIYAGAAVSGARVALADPVTLEIVEQAESDGNWYLLFSLSSIRDSLKVTNIVLCQE